LSGTGTRRPVVAAAIKDHSGGHTFIELVFSAVLPVLILIYMMRFSRSYPERVNHPEQAALSERNV
jgi:hypothetical protein